MTVSVDLHAIINDVFALKPPEQLVEQDPWAYGNPDVLMGAQAQYDELHPLVMRMAKALEQLLSQVEAQSALLREAEAINDRYDEILQSLLKEEM